MSDLTNIAQALKLVNDYGKIVSEVTKNARLSLVSAGDMGACDVCGELTSNMDEDGEWDCGCEVESDDRIYADPRRA